MNTAIECDWIVEELADEKYRLECINCNTIRIHDRPALHRICVARPAPAPNDGADYVYAEKARQIVAILREQGPSTIERVQRFLDLCPRVPGIMLGMAADGTLSLDTAAVEPQTLFSIPSERSKS